MNRDRARRVRVIDSHTGGEPTRIVMEGGPELVGASVAEKLASFRAHQQRFLREREEYCSKTMAKVQAALKDAPSSRLGE